MILTVVFLSIFLGSSVYAQKIQKDQVIKVGVYEQEPYFMLDADGNMSGYHYDLMKLLQKKHQLKYEFVVDTLDNGLKKLANQEIDIMLGVSMKSKLGDQIIFNRYRTNKEVFGVFSKDETSFESLHSNKGLKLGMVEDDANAEMVLNLFKATGADVSVVYEKDYKTLERRLEEDEIDLIVDNRWKQRDYFLVYEFSGGDVYIAGHKGSQAILDAIDQTIEKFTLETESPMTLLYKRYFNSTETMYQEIVIGIVVIAALTIIGIVFPVMKKRSIKNRIRRRMNKNQYTLQYQPIYHSMSNSVVGFEGLLRLLDKDNKLIPPLKFLPEIEENDMLFEVSIWIIKKVIDDYAKIKDYDYMREKDFYMSLNLSVKEIENDVFVDQAIKLLTQSNLGHQKICLEIIERFKTNDVDKITQNIKRLKQAGFKLAIDDFGVEYSNLDIFQKLDVDIIKVDKSLVDGIGKDSVKEEVLFFISRLAHIVNRAVVLEGVEEASQDIKIKEMGNEKLYVQGYYYNKPMYKEQIQKLKF